MVSFTILIVTRITITDSWKTSLVGPIRDEQISKHTNKIKKKKVEQEQMKIIKAEVN